ncbi:hypothetical protein BMS3Bbin06_01630 [bacterium BMS3Bbin06]|nr:hypothetical protein BMS3Abin08_02517 [bacterium BMS3Abin08]GBE35094.1 hypothetical protein BMS3Bbin06_01630 [bacterium BMS3Bbin06]HDO35071.1 hypothetical protein [Nitrospirota bacterium]HDY71457.1 hypothetical protein [Nitrospirota bacterium]
MEQITAHLFEGKHLYAILIIVFFLLLILIRLLFKKMNITTEIDDMVDASRKMDCSEFEIFRKAGERWNFSNGKVKEDFKRYLWFGELPFYVKDYLKLIFKKKQ